MAHPSLHQNSKSLTTHRSNWFITINPNPTLQQYKYLLLKKRSLTSKQQADKKVTEMFQKLFIFLTKYRNIFELSVSKTQG